MNFFDDKTRHVDDELQSRLYPGLESEADGIDLRIEMNRILYGSTFKRPLGHWVIVRVFDGSSQSKYWNKYSKEGIMGPSHDYVDYLVRCRRVPVRLSRSSMDETKTADINLHKFVYYFEWDVPVRDGDQVYELDINDHTNKPTEYNFTEKFDVSRIHPYRLENGNVQYIAAACNLNNIVY